MTESSSDNKTDAPLATLDVEQSVRERYSGASQAAEEALCCPVEYDRQYLKVLPDELIERDYGCGDPSQHISEGETVLDLGSGGGKICYIASQVVGPKGRVIGVDRNDDMLTLARKFQNEIGERIGHHNTEFHKGSIQDLALDLDRFESYLKENPIQSSNDWFRAESQADQMRQEKPMVADDSIDVVVSNCVLNLVAEKDRRDLFAELIRVLRRGGRAVISDIVADEPVPEELKNDTQLWSGCISGAFVEDDFVRAFHDAGFYGIEIVSRQEKAWAVVNGIEFRSVTIRAYKGKDGPCLDHHQAVIYRGPWSAVIDDDGHTLRRGQRMAVCGKTFEIYSKMPYADQIIPVPPNDPVDPLSAQPFNCRRNEVRPPSKTKGPRSVTVLPGEECCGGGSNNGSGNSGDCC